MANSIINGTHLASAMIGGLVDAGVLTNVVQKDANYAAPAGKGDTVNIRRLGVQTAADFTGTASQTDINEDVVSISLDHQPYVQSLVSTGEKNLRTEDFYAQVIAPGVAGVAEYLDAQVAAELATTSTARVGGSTAKATLIAAREALTESKVPAADRFLACSPAFISILLAEDWLTAEKFNDGGMALREAVVGKAFGFTIVESTHIADDIGDADEPSAFAFHKTGPMMASRTPAPPEGGADAAVASAYGMGARLIYGWDNSRLSDIVTVDTLAGFGITRDVKVVPTYIV